MNPSGERGTTGVTSFVQQSPDRLIDVEYFRFDNGDVTIWEL